jgi:hypothetical protein
VTRVVTESCYTGIGSPIEAEELMPLIIASRRTAAETLRKRYSDAPILDMTSRGPQPWVRFSPFHPHGGIPVPFSPGHTGMSVEGIWQGLKVFERADVDYTKLAIMTMQGLKRSSRSFGAVLGHCAGLNGEYLLNYIEARYTIYLPAYRSLGVGALSSRSGRRSAADRRFANCCAARLRDQHQYRQPLATTFARSIDRALCRERLAAGKALV